MDEFVSALLRALGDRRDANEASLRGAVLSGSVDSAVKMAVRAEELDAIIVEVTNMYKRFRNG